MNKATKSVLFAYLIKQIEPELLLITNNFVNNMKITSKSSFSETSKSFNQELWQPIIELTVKFSRFCKKEKVGGFEKLNQEICFFAYKNLSNFYSTRELRTTTTSYKGFKFDNVTKFLLLGLSTGIEIPFGMIVSLKELKSSYQDQQKYLLENAMNMYKASLALASLDGAALMWFLYSLHEEHLRRDVSKLALMKFNSDFYIIDEEGDIALSQQAIEVMKKKNAPISDTARSYFISSSLPSHPGCPALNNGVLGNMKEPIRSFIEKYFG